MNRLLTADYALKQLTDQLGRWALAQKNYEALRQVRVRSIDCGTFRVQVQFNPARIVSTGAKIDVHAPLQRPCFLCDSHLPEEQLRTPLPGGYQLLVNPFPIFPQHWTLPALLHQPQRIAGRLADLLLFARCLQPMVVFYNGPCSGASAPDHFHFQVGNGGFLPLEADCDSRERLLLYQTSQLSVYVLRNYGRQVVVAESDDSRCLHDFLQLLVARLPVCVDEPEPGMNIVAWHRNQRWRVCVFPRGRHRPSCYAETGGLLISPGAVDMAGVLITPRKNDFEKITASQVRQIFEEVSRPEEVVLPLLLNLKKNYETPRSAYRHSHST